MKNYRLIVDFHAENDEDAKKQADHAIDDFDDGYERAKLVTGEVTDLERGRSSRVLFTHVEAQTTPRP